MKKSEKMKFPFWGAGNASYFEWIEVVIRFINKPTEAETKKIISSAPAPIKPKKVDFSGKMLMAASDQFGNMVIEEKYGDPKKLAKFKGRFYFAGAAAIKKFNIDIERWLLEINEFCPVQFVFRREDDEAEGTKLSEWHKESVKNAKIFIAALANDPATFKQLQIEKSTFKYALLGIFDFANSKPKDISENLLEYIFPEKKLFSFLKEEKIDVVSELLNENCKEDEFCEAIMEWIESSDGKKKEVNIQFLTLSKIILSSQKLSKKIFICEDSLNNVARIAILQKDNDLVKLIETFASNDSNACGFINEIGVVAYNFQVKNYKAAIALYKLALSIKSKKKCTKLEIFCNALYLLQYDNTGLPIDKNANYWFLERCLPYAPKNPAIYYNAACLYVEMKEFDKALECIKLAKNNKYDGYNSMINSMKKEKMFSEFKKYQAFLEWTKK